MSEVCIDASLLLKLVLAEEGSDRADAKLSEWNRSGVALISPGLWLFETHSVLRTRVHRRLLTERQGREAWAHLLRQGVQSVHPADLFERAWRLAASLHQRTTYDSTYLATAEARGCDFWTADTRLAGAVGTKLPWVHLV